MGPQSTKPYVAVEQEVVAWLNQRLDKEGQSDEVDERLEIPDALLLWMQCREFGIPLVAGGILEQPEPLWSLMNTAGAAYTNYLRQRQEQKEDEAQRDVALSTAVTSALAALKEHGYNTP